MDTTAQRRKFALQAAAVAGCVAAAVTTLYVVSCDSDNSDAEDGDFDESFAATAEAAIKLINTLTDALRSDDLGGLHRRNKFASEAIALLHERETDLDNPRLTTLRDLFASDDSHAHVYTLIRDESLRKAWIQSVLKERGFPALEGDAT